MAYNELLALRIRDYLDGRKDIQEKNMFGGVAFLLNGNMLVGVHKNYLIARIGKENYEEALTERYVKEFDITSKAMKGWVMVKPAGYKKASTEM